MHGDAARVAHMHLGGFCRGGVHCFSVYLVTNEGMSEKNKAVLLNLAKRIKAVRGPWIVMGDWNLPPEALEASGWAEEVEGKICSPAVPTCKGSTLDFLS